jgi:hypothetical protein
MTFGQASEGLFIGLGPDRERVLTESSMPDEIWSLRVLEPHERLTGSPTS